MKNLIFLLISCFAFAKMQVSDSANLAKLVEQLDAKNNKIEVLIEKANQVEKKHETMFFKLKIYISKLISSKAKKSEKRYHSNNREGVKVENQTDPVTEIDEPRGVDSIRGGWLYRFFHKDDFKIKYYKIIDNEKVYLN